MNSSPLMPRMFPRPPILPTPRKHRLQIAFYVGVEFLPWTETEAFLDEAVPLLDTAIPRQLAVNLLSAASQARPFYRVA